MRRAVGSPLRLRPKRSLGQNFLRDDNIARKIVTAMQPSAGDIVVEIGPGEGALTRHLAPRVRRLIAVEIDRRAVERLQAAYPAGRVVVVNQDFLGFDLGGIAAEGAAVKDGGRTRVRVVGNIPYNRTSPILFHLLDQRTHVLDCTIMVQKEVARRLAACAGTKEYGILSVFVQLFADVKVLFDVSPNAFRPRPNVNSSVVRIAMLAAPRYPVRDEPSFRQLVRAVFGKRRKTLRSSLKYYDPRISQEMLPEFDLQRRPEQLSLEELVKLGNVVQERLGGGERP